MFYLNNIPKLDLHGEDRVGAIIKIKQFIDENVILENNKLEIIHGVGTGVLRNATHQYLKQDKRVLEYKSNNFNMGSTIVIIKYWLFK